MIRTAVLVALALGALALPADAKPRLATERLHPLCNVTMPCDLGAGFLAGIRSIDVTLTRNKARRHRPSVEANHG